MYSNTETFCIEHLQESVNATENKIIVQKIVHLNLTH